MSYLRACWLGIQFGADVSRYRREIEKVLPAIVAHLPTRGVDQRMGFALLFSQLGYPQPETLEKIYPETLIAKQVPLGYFLASPDRPYDITHEVFALTERGASKFRFPRREDETYAKDTVARLLEDSMRRNNLDLAGEFLVNLAELGEGGSPERTSSHRPCARRARHSQGPEGPSCLPIKSKAGEALLRKAKGLRSYELPDETVKGS